MMVRSPGRAAARAALVGVLFLPFLVLAGAMLWRDGDWSSATLIEAWRVEAMTLLPRTVALAAGATAVAVIAGGAVGAALALGRFPARRALSLLSFAPLLLPPAFQVAVLERLAVPGGVLHLLISSWAEPDKPFPFRNAVWAALVLGWSHAPIVAGCTLLGILGIPKARIDAARPSRGPAAVLWTIVLPLAFPAIAAGAAIVFTLSLLNYEVPRLLDVVTYAVQICVHYGADDEPGLAFAAALPVLAVAALALLATLSWAARRGFALAGRSDPGAALPAARPGILALGIVAAWLAAAIVLPVALLVDLAGPAATYSKAWRAEWDKILATAVHTLGVGLLAPLVAAALLLPPRGAIRPRAWLWLPFALPGALLGFACSRMGQTALLFPLYNGDWLLLFAHVVRYFPVAYLALAAHLRSVPAELWAAADLLPAASRRWWGTRVPLAARGLTAGAVATAVLASGELQATLLLAAPGSHPVIIEIYNLLHYHPERQALAALCLFHMGSVIAAAAVLGLAGRCLGGRRVERWAFIGPSRGS